MIKLTKWLKKNKKVDKEQSSNVEKIDLEKKDIIAIIIAAFITIMPVVLFILAAFYFIIWLIFLR